MLMHDSPTQAIAKMSLSFKSFKIRFCLQKGRKPLVRFTKMPGGVAIFSVGVAANDCLKSAEAAWAVAKKLAEKLDKGEIQEGELAKVRGELFT